MECSRGNFREHSSRTTPCQALSARPECGSPTAATDSVTYLNEVYPTRTVTYVVSRLSAVLEAGTAGAVLTSVCWGRARQIMADQVEALGSALLSQAHISRAEPLGYGLANKPES